MDPGRDGPPAAPTRTRKGRALATLVVLVLVGVVIGQLVGHLLANAVIALLEGIRLD